MMVNPSVGGVKVDNSNVMVLSVVQANPQIKDREASKAMTRIWFFIFTTFPLYLKYFLFV
jgi:hypothetical protein